MSSPGERSCPSGKSHESWATLANADLQVAGIGNRGSSDVRI